ncbi:hypothetical protein [Pedobacter sp. ASV28]|uniref:hypothetical protein n=1 Tax=Pedobacter sp. ASV28 TaxID=2795123 RepID=UPI0018EAE96C|nr:hypothetical protein [Pedobacter sp. ASV28]
MKNKTSKEINQLATLLKKEMDIPSAQYSSNLLHVAMASYRVSYRTKYKKEERLGKIIIGILIFFNLMMLYLLKPFTINPAILLACLVALVTITILMRIAIRLSKLSPLP